MFKRGLALVTTLVREQLGVPVTLRRFLQEQTEALRAGLEILPAGLAAGNITCWHEWGDAWRDGGEAYEPGELPGWKTQHNFKYKPQRQVRQDLLRLATVTRQPQWRGDIRDVAGLQANRAELVKFDSLDVYAQTRARSHLSEITRARLNALLSHKELRFLRRPKPAEYFLQPLWDGRIFLLNGGGSPQFAAARFIAGQIGQAVPLAGELRQCSLEPLAVSGLRRDFELFALSMRDPQAIAGLHDALRRLRAPYLWKPMPQPHAQAQVLFLPREDRRAQAAAAELRAAGLPDVGKHLSALVLRQHIYLVRQREGTQAQAA
ncbi:DUF6685 family protein [Azohydromonas lata]|uniref:DUF6685 family protein n=1 Tax=Azohydromonas lata TaxID=45677 RepID=A0ABU5IPU7_9BURK|nr:DUF6685 family protein [Azohydromonas lata]MDZ5460931.1 DUF6685 family protein [Azohydromonas lata]